MNKRGLTALVAVFIWLFYSITSIASNADWKTEFEAICSKVEIAESLSDRELKGLIKRADELLEQLKEMDLSTKKVYIFRLKKCRSFFNYILELRKNKD